MQDFKRPGRHSWYGSSRKLKTHQTDRRGTWRWDAKQKMEALTLTQSLAIVSLHLGLGNDRSKYVHGKWLTASRPFTILTAALPTSHKLRPRSRGLGLALGLALGLTLTPPEGKKLRHLASDYLREITECAMRLVIVSCSVCPRF